MMVEKLLLRFCHVRNYILRVFVFVCFLRSCDDFAYVLWMFVFILVFNCAFTFWTILNSLFQGTFTFTQMILDIVSAWRRRVFYFKPRSSAKLIFCIPRNSLALISLKSLQNIWRKSFFLFNLFKQIFWYVIYLWLIPQLSNVSLLYFGPRWNILAMLTILVSLLI
jgi:hypothetical protein